MCMTEVLIMKKKRYGLADVRRGNYLPRGYSAACLVEFDSMPALLNKLVVCNQPINANKHDMLHMSQKTIRNETLRPMKEKTWLAVNYQRKNLFGLMSKRANSNLLIRQLLFDIVKNEKARKK